MEQINFAAIDIGSNAVRLLIKGIYKGETAKELKKTFIVRVPLRLGQDTFTLGRISNDKTERLLRLITAFKQMMQVYRVVSYRACATSAMREALNGKEITHYISKQTGINIDIINGKEEARIVYDSHIVDLLNRPGDYLYVDVGGGSTETSLIHDCKLKDSRSYDIGTVRILNNKVKKEEILRLYSDLKLLAAEYPDVSIIGSGGNINKIYKLSGTKKGDPLSIKDLYQVLKMLQALPVKERMKQYDLRADRADVIVPAAELFLQITRHLNCQCIWVPTIGIADGIIYTLCSNYLNTHN